MTPNALRRRSDLVVALAHLVPELPDDEKEAASLVVAWLAKSVATAKLGDPDPQYGAAVKLVAKAALRDMERGSRNVRTSHARRCS